MMKRSTAWLVLISLILLISACGNNMPTISSELLQSKKSILVISKPGLNEQTAAIFQKTLLAWRDTQHIAYEWLPEMASITEPQIEKIKTIPYDYIIVIGNELTSQAFNQAASIPDKKWILLDDNIAQAPADVKGNQVVWKQTGPGFVEKQWQEWVKQQQVIGKRLEWITTSTNPIPSIWAPSEEAEYISLSDAEGWYSQFQYQVRQHGPDWLVVYSPLDPTVLQRMKNLQVPIMNMSVTSINVQWEAVMAAVLDQIQKQWIPGLQVYQNQEITVNKQP
jgi:predicted nucleic acid-binding protein